MPRFRFRHHCGGSENAGELNLRARGLAELWADRIALRRRAERPLLSVSVIPDPCAGVVVCADEVRACEAPVEGHPQSVLREYAIISVHSFHAFAGAFIAPPPARVVCPTRAFLPLFSAGVGNDIPRSFVNAR